MHAESTERGGSYAAIESEGNIVWPARLRGGMASTSVPDPAQYYHIRARGTIIIYGTNYGYWVTKLNMLNRARPRHRSCC